MTAPKIKNKEVILRGIGTLKGETRTGLLEALPGHVWNQILVRLPSGLKVYFHDHGTDDPETGTQVSGGVSGWVASWRDPATGSLKGAQHG